MPRSRSWSLESITRSTRWPDWWAVKTPVERKALLTEHLAQEHVAATTYAWVDRPAGTVRLPIARAIELTVRDHAKK